MDERFVDWGASGRITSYSACTVDPFTLEEQDVIYLKEDGSSITYSYTSDNHMQATIDLLEGDYLNGTQQRMVRVYENVTIGGYSYGYCMGTFFVSNLTNNSLYGRQKRQLSCYGPMYRYTQDYLAENFDRSAGTNCVENIRYIIEQHGGRLTIGDGVDTTRTHTQDVHFQIGANLAEVLNTYAGWIGCEIVSDINGTVMLREYVPPTERSPVYTFEEGTNCVYLPGIEYEVNRDEPINRVVAYFSRDKKDEGDPWPLFDSCHVELSDAESFSYQNCGRYRTQVVEGQAAGSHEDLLALAQRVLDESAASILYIHIEHAGIPWLRVGDCVRYINNLDQGNPNDTYAIVEEMAIGSLSPMCMTKTKLRVYV